MLERHRTTGPGDRNLAGVLKIRSDKQLRGWLATDKKVFDGCVGDDDKLDAMVSALVARSVVRGCSQQVSDHERASREGWIHLPQPLSLGYFCG